MRATMSQDTGAPVRVLVFPRSPNPYQHELYTAMAASDRIVVRYVEGPTRSQTLNLLILPVLLVVGRARGFRILHIHWVYSFGLAWASGRRARRVVERWYRLTLAVASAVGLKVVWTAHNILPHEPVFVDDVAARRELVGRCDAVIAHDESAASIVRAWGARRVSVVPGGVSLLTESEPPTRTAACVALGADPTPVRVLFFGSIRDYKGVDLLLAAMAEIDPDIALHLTVVGSCPDVARRAALQAAAAALPAPERVQLWLEFVPDALLAIHLAAADFAVFPFRSVTNSSSVLHALAAGLPVIVPALPALGDVPDSAAVRYDADDGRVALVGALETAASIGAGGRATMASAATEFASSRSWPNAADATWAVYDDVLTAGAGRSSPTCSDGRSNRAQPRTAFPTEVVR